MVPDSELDLAAQLNRGVTLRFAAVRKRTLMSAVLPVIAAACASTPWQGTERDPSQVAFAGELGVDLAQMEQVEPGLYVQDLVSGGGRAAGRTSRVWIHYITWLPDGTIVDTNVGGEPFAFRLGEDEVIRGWDRAIAGMQIGGNRRLVVRPGLAYGSRGTARVPPGTTLVFQVELVDTR